MYECYVLGNTCKIKGLSVKEANEVLLLKNTRKKLSLSEMDEFWLGYMRGENSLKKSNTTNHHSVKEVNHVAQT